MTTRRFKYRFAYYCLVLLLANLIPATASATSLNENLSVTVPGTALVITGEAIPDSFITITNDGSIIASLQASSSGVFSYEITAITPGINNLFFQESDQNNTLSSTIEVSVNVSAQIQTNLSIFLPPTINLNPASLVLTGYSYPDSTITIYLTNGLLEQTDANSSGQWELNLDSLTLPNGTYNAYAIASNSSGESYDSATLSFKINNYIPPATQQPASLNTNHTISAFIHALITAPQTVSPQPSVPSPSPTAKKSGVSGSSHSNKTELNKKSTAGPVVAAVLGSGAGITLVGWSYWRFIGRTKYVKKYLGRRHNKK